MFEFGHPKYLTLLWLIPIAIMVFWLRMMLARKKLKTLGRPEILQELIPALSVWRPVYKFSLWLLAFIMIIILLARPRYGIRTEEVRKKGLELVIALDVSNSMLAQDITPNRLMAAKQAISQLINRLKDDRLSLIVFAGDAFTQLPMTNDYGVARMFVNVVEPSLVSVQGTSISAALRRAAASFSENDVRNKAIIIVTDGEDHQGDALELAKEISEKGIRIFSLGIGSPEGVPIPSTVRPGDFHRDQQGNTVITRLNEGMLQQLAQIGNGAYIRASNSLFGLNELYDELQKMEKGEVVGKVFAEYEEQYPFFAGFAFLLLFIEMLIANRKSDFWPKINPLNRI
ncbi:MAG TPA: VWA domain-containing protein [Salinivirgaceae bacterium]|nr:VWA domain-containing protein [Salinivirgaceae bacterium]